MKNHYHIILLAILFSTLTACAPRQLSKPYKASKINHLYSQSVGDAAKPQEWEVEKSLVKINEASQNLVWKEFNGESYVLVTSWKEDTTYYKNDKKTVTYNTSKYPIWVTAVPEVQQICKSKRFGRKEGLDLRLKQLLGLPPNVEKNYFVEFWVRPQDMFRPCLDGEISEVNCSLAFPEDVTEEHKEWINNLRLESYYNPAWDKNYPWSQLGYTFDWHPKNKNNVGLSEFVIGKDKAIIVNRIYTTTEYCEVARKK